MFGRKQMLAVYDQKTKSHVYFRNLTLPCQAQVTSGQTLTNLFGFYLILLQILMKQIWESLGQ